jgi:3-dehydroquinate synthase
MVDASIGGKTAIDIPEGKNLVGAFHQPRAVIADTRALQTLSDRTFATGMAEVIKHGLIDAGPLRAWLLGNVEEIDARAPQTLETLVADAAAVKIRIVSQDEKEHGARAFLNYGHTLAHALETLGGYEGLTHGEAVALGMMFAAHLAVELGLADRVKEHRDALEAFDLPTGGARAPLDEVTAVMARDKKYQAGMRFVVLEDLGKPKIARDVPDDAIARAYEAVR